VHELVHYRFDYLQYGARFENRVREILRGKVFPQKQLYDDSITQSKKNNATENNNNIPIVTRQELITNYL
jgi:hypothetical protein